MHATPIVTHPLTQGNIMEKRAEEFVRLPVLYESWARLKGDLQVIASKTDTGPEALEKLLEKNEGGSVGLALLRKVLAQKNTTEHFSEVQLPWLAVKALQVEELFKKSEYKIKVITGVTEFLWGRAEDLSTVGKSVVTRPGPSPLAPSLVF